MSYILVTDHMINEVQGRDRPRILQPRTEAKLTWRSVWEEAHSLDWTVSFVGTLVMELLCLKFLRLSEIRYLEILSIVADGIWSAYSPPSNSRANACLSNPAICFS
jgi:hypothetical protein